jgi:hypothetical protein
MAAPAPAGATGTRMAQPQELLLTFDFRKLAAAPKPPLPTAATVTEAIARWLNEQL